MNAKPLGKNIVIYRDEEADEELYKTSLALPDSAKGRSQVSIVLDAGPGTFDIYPGERVVTRRINAAMDDITALGGGKYLVPQRMALLKLTFGKNEDGTWWRSYRPFGTRVLAKRLNKEFVSRAGIIIPDHTEYLEQTPFSEIVEVGPECYGIKRGDKIVAEWSTAIAEIGLGSAESTYFALYPLEGIRFRFDCEVQDLEMEMRTPSVNEINRRKKYEKHYKK